MSRLVAGLLDTSHEVSDTRLSARARDLTVSWLRWGYFGDVLEGNSVAAILRRALEEGYEHCLIQSYGHIISEQSGPQGGRSVHFFEALRQFTDATEYSTAGKIFWTADGEYGLLSRCLLVNLKRHRQFGCPDFGPSLSQVPTGAVPMDRLELGAAAAFHRSGGSLIDASLRHGLPARGFASPLDGLLIDLGSDARGHPPFADAMVRQCANAARGVFVLNFESYRDIEEPPPDFTPPVSVLYSVAAGLKPNRILHTHGFDSRTRVVYFDYSSQGLEFRRRLLGEWDGRDYPSFLRSLFQRLPPASTHYYLWPGATPENLDWTEMDRLWQAELARWGGEAVIADHWSRVRSLPHEFLLCNILSENQALLDRLEDIPGAVIWWSNAFSTIYSAWNYTLDQKRTIYASWIRALAGTAPRIFLYGSDHSNSSVNGITAGDYAGRYESDGGDPLRARQFHRHQICF